jgi:hypothetical protein
MKRSPLVFTLLLLAACAGYAQEFIGPHGYLTLEAEISTKDSVGKRGTFDLHHFNLFGDYLLNEKARVFGEIEFEHGADTEREEYGDAETGFVRVERAWFEYAFSEKFKLQLGKFLTPYGIYNEIHDAAPAYDSSILPVSIYGKHRNPFGDEQRFYAKFSLGVQALGRFELGNTELQYQVMVGNGRGLKPFEQDDNKDKALGGRLLADFSKAGLKLGYSFYTDKNGAAFHTRQTSHAGDLRLEFKHWRFNAEFAHSTLGMLRTVRTQNANAVYGELARQFFNRQTVFVRYDVFNPDTRRGRDWERDFTLGTSVQILKQAVAKAEAHFWRIENGAPRRYTQAIASLAVVF